MCVALLPKPESGLELQVALPKPEAQLLLLLDATDPKPHPGIPKAGPELLEAASPNRPLLKAVLSKPEAGLLLCVALPTPKSGLEL